MTKLHGVIVPVATPLRRDETPDPEAAAGLVERLIAAGVHGLFANGSMGGFAFHPDAVQDCIIQNVVAAARGRLPVLAGVADTSVRRVLDRIARLPRGVEAAVVLAPYYFVYSPAEIVRFFETVAGESPLPIVLYENPRLVPYNTIAPESVAKLAQHRNIVGLKNSSPEQPQWDALFAQDLPRDRFALICGAEKRMGDGLRAGYDGLTGGFHNVFPEVAVALYDAACAGDWPRVDALQAKLNRAYRIFEIAGGWRGLEIAFQRMGIATKAAVRPFDDSVTPEVRLEIERILEQEKE